MARTLCCAPFLLVIIPHASVYQQPEWPPRPSHLPNLPRATPTSPLTLTLTLPGPASTASTTSCSYLSLAPSLAPSPTYASGCLPTFEVEDDCMTYRAKYDHSKYPRKSGLQGSVLYLVSAFQAFTIRVFGCWNRRKMNVFSNNL